MIGINDYLFLNGYRRVLEERARGRLQNIELMLPVLELRLDRFGGASHNHLSRVNYHVIFSNSLDPDTIQHQFINRLQADYRLNPDSPLVTWGASPTLQSLRDLGQQIIESVPDNQRHRFGTPLQEGFRNLNFSLRSIREALESPYFADKHLTAVGKAEWESIRWSDSTIADKKDVINGANIVFTAAESADNCVSARRRLESARVNAKLMDCSDAHCFAASPDKDRLGNCFTWINADTEFEGLIRAVKEYDDRVYLGAQPDKLLQVSSNRTRYVRSVAISKSTGASLSEPWFDGTTLAFNYGLVAIIGNKGSGKSALLDIIGLLGDSSRHRDASFLSNERFLHPGDNKGHDFEAALTWEDDRVLARRLDDDVPIGAVERVTYIPQKAFESICNELGSSERGQFDAELKRVIFSHVKPADRYGCDTLDDVLEFRAAELRSAASQLREKLSALNREILSLERRARPEHKATLANQLERRRAELSALEAARPPEVPEPPGATDPAVLEVLGNISAKQQLLDDTEQAIRTAEERLGMLRRESAVLGRVTQRLDTFARRYEELRQITREELEPLGLDVDSIVHLEIADGFLGEATALRETEAETLSRQLGETEQVVGALDDSEGELQLSDEAAESTAEQETISGRRERLLREIEGLRLSLDAAHEQHQTYLAELSSWQAERARITGETENPGSIAALESAIADLADIPDVLQRLFQDRRDLAREIHSCLGSIAEHYRAAYAPVQRFIAEHAVARDVFNLRFEAALVDAGFEDRFWDWINRGRIGSSLGQDEGSARLRTLLAERNLNDTDDAVIFAEAIRDHLTHDRRTPSASAVYVADQLRAGRSEEALFDFLYGFEYLEARFGLRMGDRQLHQLSPGEKGALLLVFYLLVDRSDVPLLIDQPEENLDNQTVVSLLVPSVREAKRRRQIFLVTHNPNLAIVCSADQIICAERPAGAEPRLTYVSGAVENPLINRKVVDVLEGTKPAFDARGATYMQQAAEPQVMAASPGVNPAIAGDVPLSISSTPPQPSRAN